MGFTAQIVLTENSSLVFRISGATYRAQQVVIEDIRSSTWFVREPQEELVNISWKDLAQKPNKLEKFPIPGEIGEIAELQVRWRRASSKDTDGNDLIAVTAVVAHKGNGGSELFSSRCVSG